MLGCQQRGGEEGKVPGAGDWFDMPSVMPVTAALRDCLGSDPMSQQPRGPGNDGNYAETQCSAPWKSPEASLGPHSSLLFATGCWEKCLDSGPYHPVTFEIQPQPEWEPGSQGRAAAGMKTVFAMLQNLT